MRIGTHLGADGISILASPHPGTATFPIDLELSEAQRLRDMLTEKLQHAGIES